MKVNLAGKVKDINLSANKVLLPLFEAVVNSIQAIEEAKLKIPGHIRIRILCDKTLLTDEDKESQEIVGFEIEDDGIGFTESNINSFDEEYSEHKVKKGGKGLGRFCWLCVFDKVEVNSIFVEDKKPYCRSFDFSIDSGFDPEKGRKTEVSDYKGNATTVRLKTIRKVRGRQAGSTDDRYSALRSMQGETIARRIIEHCLEYFVGSTCPKITIEDPRIDEEISLNVLFESEITTKSEIVELEIHGNKFTILHVRLQGAYASDHLVHYCAHSRVVLSEKIVNQIPNLKHKIKDDEGNRFTYAAYVDAQLLDDTVNSDRTGFALSEDDQDLFDEEITWNDIQKEIVEASKEYLEPYTEPIQARKMRRIKEFVKHRPRYRYIMKYADSLLEDMSPDADETQMEAKLYEAYCHIETDLIKEGKELFARKLDDGDVQKYEAEFKEFFEKANNLNQSDLVRYVCHRKIILEFLKKLLELRDNEKYQLEESLHNTIFPLGKTLEDAPECSHNLWVLDEKLVYHDFLASDKQLRTTTEGTESQLEPDIISTCPYDVPNAFGIHSNSTLHAVVIVEFKRPMRTSYPDKKDASEKDDNPFTQVYNYIDKINENGPVTSTGRPINVSPNAPFYCYIIADLNNQLQSRSKAAGLTPCPEGPAFGFFGYNSNYNAYIEVISYDKMISDAEKRNTAFFDKLNI